MIHGLVKEKRIGTRRPFPSKLFPCRYRQQVECFLRRMSFLYGCQNVGMQSFEDSRRVQVGIFSLETFNECFAVHYSSAPPQAGFILACAASRSATTLSAHHFPSSSGLFSNPDIWRIMPMTSSTAWRVLEPFSFCMAIASTTARASAWLVVR